MDDDLSKLADFLTLSRRTSRILMQNIVLALGIKAVLLVLALAGQATSGWRFLLTWVPACWWCSTACGCCASRRERSVRR
jgi:cation transport ATPase